MPRSLTSKQQKFVNEICKGVNPSQAYINAYKPTTKNKNTISKQANRLLNSPYISPIIAENKKQIQEKINYMNYKKNEESDFDYIFDNVISAFGKIIYFQFDCDFIQKNLYELIDIWISNLPIKFDNNEIFSQHELLCDFFFGKKKFYFSKFVL